MDKHDLKEASLVWDLQDTETKKKMQRRANELLRLIELAKKSKKKALDAGDIDLSNQLDAKIEEMQNLAANLDYYDQFDDENEEEAEIEQDSESDSQDDSEEQSGKDGSEEESENKNSEEETETSEAEKSESEDDPEDDPNGPNSDPNGPEDEPGNKPDDGPEDDPIGPDGDPGDKKNKNDSKDDQGDDPDDEPGDGPDGDPGNKKNKKDSSGDDPEEDDNNESDDESEDDSESDDGQENSNKGNKSKNGQSGEEEDEEEDEDDPIEDIFKMEPPTPSMSNGKKSKEPRKPSLEEIIQQLSRLEGPSLDGAIEALQDILNSDANESLENKLNLTEAVKPITHMSEDEFDDYVNDALDLIEKGTNVTYTDLKDRKTKIQQLANDPVETKKLNNEDRDNKAKSDPERAIKASEREKQRYNNVGTIEQFELNFFRAINDQVEMVKQQLQTYDEINNEYEGENIIMKADVEKEIPEEDRPVINFYFDVSGSWTEHPDAIEIGKRAVATVKEFEDKGEVVLNVYYFGDTVSPHMQDVWGGGTKAWPHIVKNIKDTEAKNVVIMTDCDMGYLFGRGIGINNYAEVEGCVWWLWSLYDYTGGSPLLKLHLRGHSDNLEYAFGSGGYYKPM